VGIFFQALADVAAAGHCAAAEPGTRPPACAGRGAPRFVCPDGQGTAPCRLRGHRGIPSGGSEGTLTCCHGRAVRGPARARSGRGGLGREPMSGRTRCSTARDSRTGGAAPHGPDPTPGCGCAPWDARACRRRNRSRVSSPGGGRPYLTATSDPVHPGQRQAQPPTSATVRRPSPFTAYTGEMSRMRSERGAHRVR
jgi:hypothetical protein